MANVFNSQIIPYNTGVPLSSPPSWPVTSGTYDDGSTTTGIQSGFTKVSVNPRIVTRDTSDWNTLKSISCYEIHSADSSTTTVSSKAVYPVSNVNASSVLNRLYPFSTTIESYLSTKSSTAGYRIHSDTTLSNILDGSVLDADYDYFVVVYADDPLKHHLAKITEIHSYDTVGDGFDFSPKLSDDIPVGTKFTIYKGPAATNTHICAVGYGLMGDASTTDYRHDVYVEVSRPTFYFYPDRSTELDRLLPATKYRVIKNIAYTKSGTYTIDYGKVMSGSVSQYHTSSPDFQKHGTSVCFLTEPDYGDYIPDSGMYSQFGTLVDNLRNADNTISHTGSGTNMTQTLISQSAFSTHTTTGNVSIGEWNKCFFNYQREGFAATTCANDGVYDGITRYVEYSPSSESVRQINQVLNVDVFKSITQSGNYADITIADPNKIMDIKIQPYSDFRVRQMVTEGEYTGEASQALPGKVTNVSNNFEFRNLNANQDLRKLISSGSSSSDYIYGKIRIGNVNYIGYITAAPAIDGDNGYKQIFTPVNYRDITQHNTWQSMSGYTVNDISEGTAYTRTWNPYFKHFISNQTIDTESDGTTITKNGTTITSSKSDVYNTELVLRDKEVTGYITELDHGDKNNNWVKPKTTHVPMYQPTVRIVDGTTIQNVPNLYDYIDGNFIINRVTFDGTVEYMEDKIDNGALKYKITGRDNIHKLLDIVVNKNYTHSEEYIYSTLNPISEVMGVSGWRWHDFDKTDTTATIWHASSGQSAPVSSGDLMYYKREDSDWYYFLGIVSTIASTTVSNVSTSSGAWDSHDNQVSGGGTNYLITFDSPIQYSSYSRPGGMYSDSTMYFAKPSTVAAKSLASNILSSSFPTTLKGCGNKGIAYESGHEISLITGVEGVELASKKSNDSKYSAGYPISNIRGGTTTTSPHSFSIRDATDTTDQTIHTISSTTEYAVSKIEELDDKTNQITLAPICPIILGKIASNTSDTRLSNSQGLYLLNTQGMPQGGYVHMISEEKDSNKATLTFSNVAYAFDADATFPTATTIHYTYEDNYGPFLWKYTDLQKGLGSVYWDYEFFDKVWEQRRSAKNINQVYGNTSYISGYAITQRIDYTGQVIPHNTQQLTKMSDGTAIGEYQKLPSIESRDSFAPIQGSRFWDITHASSDHITVGYKTGSASAPWKILDGTQSRYPMVFSRNGPPSETRYAVSSNFQQEANDRKTETFHLFSIGDIRPDSYKRTNSIGYTNRTLSNYSVIFKSKGAKEAGTISHSQYQGSLPNTIEQDSSYDSMPIHNSSKNTSEMKRIGLVRLIEATYDWHFNEVDIENLPDRLEVATTRTGPIVISYDWVEAGYDTVRPLVTGQNGEPKNDLSDHYIYYIMDRGPTPAGAEAFNNSMGVFTDPNVNVSNPNVFGHYQQQYICENSNSAGYTGITTVDGSGVAKSSSWVTVTGTLKSDRDIVSSVSAQPTSAVNGTYHISPANITHANGTAGSYGDGVHLTVVVSGGSNQITSVKPYRNVWPDTDIIRWEGRGWLNLAGNTLTISAGQLGSGSSTAVITIDPNDIENEHRLYMSKLATGGFEPDGEFVNGAAHYTYRGALYVAPYGEGTWNASNASPPSGSIFGFSSSGSSSQYYDRYHSHGKSVPIHKYSQIQSYNPNLMLMASSNLFLDSNYYKSSTNQHRHVHSYDSDDEPDDYDTGEKFGNVNTYDCTGLMIPYVVRGNRRDGGPTNAQGNLDAGLWNLNSVKSNRYFMSSRVLDRMGTWNDSRSTTNIGAGIFYLYYDMIGIVGTDASNIPIEYKIMEDDDTTVGSAQTANDFDNVSRVPQLGQFKTSSSFNSAGPATIKKGATIPLNIGEVRPDGGYHEEALGDNYSGFAENLNFPVLALGVDYSGSSPALATTYSRQFGPAAGADIKSKVYTSPLRHTNKTHHSEHTVVSKEVKSVDIAQMAEWYFKPVLRTNASNVSVKDINACVFNSSGTDLAVNNNISMVGTIASPDRCIIAIEDIDRTNGTYDGRHDTTGVANAVPHTNVWINFVNDLTGYYLVSEEGKLNDNNDSTYSYNVEGIIPKNIHKIISHTINDKGYKLTHYLEIDNTTYSGGAPSVSTKYRVMRMSHNCTYDFTPNEIELYKMTKTYTRQFREDKCFSGIKRIEFQSNFQFDSETNEGVFSMYLPIDSDGRSTYVTSREDNEVITTDGANNTFKHNTSYDCILTDGNEDNNMSVLFQYVDSTSGSSGSSGESLSYRPSTKIIFGGQMFNSHGILSIGETFTIQTFFKPQMTSNRCSIASSFNVVAEADDIINDILESNNITYTKDTTSTDKYYVGPSIVGLDAYNVISGIATYKGKRIDVDGTDVTLRDKVLANDYTTISLSEHDEDTQLVSLKRNKSTYDFFNEVIVYGDGVKGVARDRESIKETNRTITKELVDLSIKIESQAYDKAYNYLTIFRNLSNQISFQIPKYKLPYVKAGQIISLEYPSEHIPKTDYSILDIQYKMNGLMDVTVGEYNKDLTQTIANLISENKKQAGEIRGSRYTEPSPTITEAIEPKITERRITVSKSSLYSNLFGFGTYAKFAFTTKFGFDTSGVTGATVILDEDLTE